MQWCKRSPNAEAVDLTQADPATDLTSTAIGWTEAMGTLAFDFRGA